MNIFDTNEAAEYLELSVPAVKYHIYTSGLIVGQLKGNSLIFTQDALDEFKRNKRPQGRPRKTE